MPCTSTKVAFFFSSYAPLWVILGFKSLPEWMPWFFGIPFYLIAVVSVGWLFYYLNDLEGKTEREIKIISVIPKDKEVANYLIFYLFPFLGLDLGQWQDALSIGLLFLVLAVLYTRARMTYVNPMLGLTGYHFYEIELQENGERKICGLITKSPYVRSGQHLDHVYEKEDYVYVQKKPDMINGNDSDGGDGSNDARYPTQKSWETQRIH